MNVEEEDRTEERGRGEGADGFGGGSLHKHNGTNTEEEEDASVETTIRRDIKISCTGTESNGPLIWNPKGITYPDGNITPPMLLIFQIIMTT